MADSTGVNAETGKVLTDWEHVQQSIRIILTTPIGSRVMRRDFGSNLPDLIDRKLTPRGVLAIYSATALALIRWEPRFQIFKAAITTADQNGHIHLALYGTYFPRGHLGDYSVAKDKSMRVEIKKGS